MLNRNTEARNKTTPWLYLLLLPHLGLLAPFLYAHSGPVLFGFPFFYWYQFAWVPLTSLIIGLVYWRVR